VVIEGEMNGRRKRFAYDVDWPREADHHEFIPRLWATRRIGYLLDEIRLHGEDDELRDEVTELARRYGIVTPYTAYLIVEDEKRRAVPMARRTMQDFARDREVQAQAADAWETFSDATVGPGAVTGARASQTMKSAPVVAGRMARAEGRRAFATARPVSGEVVRRFDRYAQQSRFVNGRTFYLNGDEWIDASIARLADDARRERIEFASDEYFALLKRYPAAVRWLSVGRNVQVVIGGKIYEVGE
jgi:Ca-activated chloride channel family protein